LEGDVLLPRPSWVSYEPQVKHAGKRLFWVETDEQDRHTITSQSTRMDVRHYDNYDTDKLAGSSLQTSFDRAVEEGARPRIMLINSPSNPTGQAFSQTTLHEITSFCRDNSITLISDEIYADLTFDEKDRTTPCSKENFDAGCMIMTGGLSKVSSQL
jgi:aspartate aminotransferase